MNAPRTLYDKLWDAHVVHDYGEGRALLYIDRHLVQEVSSPMAFEMLRERRLTVRRPLAHLAVADHAVSTDRMRPNPRDSLAAMQVERLVRNVKATGMPYIDQDDPRRGIVHVIGPEIGFTLPGCTLVCGDSHTSTHGAFGALAFGIGSSQCETVFATQCLHQSRQMNMRIELAGTLKPLVSMKDVALALIARIGTAGAAGHAVEFTGPAVATLSMDQRMTLCNMVIEAGARIGLIAPDATTFSYLEGRILTPGGPEWDRARGHWETLRSDAGAHFDRVVLLDVSAVRPQVSWGTNPQQTIAIDDALPEIGELEEPDAQNMAESALAYMKLEPGQKLTGVPVQKVFIGSCTNARIEDLRAAAAVVRGRKVNERVRAMVVPGSAQVAEAARSSGLDRVFLEAGFEWREPGCSMCVAMNADRLEPGERCASTSNRNFEGRQGQGGMTHIMSPEMAAAAAITGSITDVRRLDRET